MELNIRELLSGHPCRLRYVFRYSTSRVSHPESVAEHSYYVALYCLVIADSLRDSKQLQPTLGPLLARALIHDLEEARSGDFPRPFKRSTPQLHMQLTRAGEVAFKQVVGSFWDSKMTDIWFDEWAKSKDESKEGRILEFADFLAVLSFMLQEGAGAGNQSIKEHVAGMTGYFKMFLERKYDFIRPLVDQTAVLMKEVFPDA